MKTISLNEAWAERERLRAEVDKLRGERLKLWVEVKKRWGEAKKLSDEAEKLSDEAEKLKVETEKRWEEAVKAHGNRITAWKLRPEKEDYACQLDNGETFEPIKTRGGEKK